MPASTADPFSTKRNRRFSPVRCGWLISGYWVDLKIVAIFARIFLVNRLHFAFDILCNNDNLYHLRGQFCCIVNGSNVLEFILFLSWKFTNGSEIESIFERTEEFRCKLFVKMNNFSLEWSRIMITFVVIILAFVAFLLAFFYPPHYFATESKGQISAKSALHKWNKIFFANDVSMILLPNAMKKVKIKKEKLSYVYLTFFRQIRTCCSPILRILLTSYHPIKNRTDMRTILFLATL